MSKLSKIFSVIFTIAILSSLAFGQAFTRVGEIPLPTGEGAWGSIISGVDFDGDGLKEIYTVNQNWNDGGFPGELVPKIYKYEFDGFGAMQLVWSDVSEIPLQNTWPALTYADLDADGKMEVIWCPVNFLGSSNPNPNRILVYEAKGDGSDEMGVPDGSGGYLPNAATTITDVDQQNLRPVRIFAEDIDGDGTTELAYVSRVSQTGPGNRFGILSVSDVPDNGDGSETWTLEFDDNAGTIAAGTAYDAGLMGSTLYIVHGDGQITPITYDGSAYSIGTSLAAVGTGTWQAAQTVDLDGDSNMEMILPNWSAPPKVYLLQDDGTNVTQTEIADLSSLVGAAARLYGSSVGDIDQDGNLDIVMGTRGATPDAAIIRLEYIGGDILSASSYEATIIDSEYPLTGGRWMFVSVGDLDKDPKLEVVYSEGTGIEAPMIILDEDGVLPVELSSFSASVSQGQVTLNWTTETEVNNQGFEVQRKSSTSDFSTIGFVEGFGSTTEKQSYKFVDNNNVFGTYTYRLKQVDFGGNFTYSDEIEVRFDAPVSFELGQNYPNPFNPATTIKFGIPEQSNVSLKIFNLIGEEVATLVNNEFKEAGTYTVTFDASSLASGTYIYSLQAGDQVQSKKMILMK